MLLWISRLIFDSRAIQFIATKMKIYVFLSIFTLVDSFFGRKGLFERHMNGGMSQREIKEENEIELIDMMLARALMMKEEMSKYTIIKKQVFEKINPKLRISHLQVHFEKLFDEFYMKYFLKK